MKEENALSSKIAGFIFGMATGVVPIIALLIAITFSKVYKTRKQIFYYFYGVFVFFIVVSCIHFIRIYAQVNVVFIIISLMLIAGIFLIEKNKGNTVIGQTKIFNNTLADLAIKSALISIFLFLINHISLLLLRNNLDRGFVALMGFASNQIKLFLCYLMGIIIFSYLINSLFKKYIVLAKDEIIIFYPIFVLSLIAQDFAAESLSGYFIKIFVATVSGNIAIKLYNRKIGIYIILMYLLFYSQYTRF